jgi:hypothetical protein
MQVHLYDEILAAIILAAGVMAARPVILWLLKQLYQLFIGTGHI